MALKPEILEAIEALPIEAYLDREGIEYRVTHGSSGEQLNLKECPACGTAKWKVFLNRDTGLGNCFSGSCEARFNKFSFIRFSSGLGGKRLDDHILQVGREIGWRPARKSLAVVANDPKTLVLPASVPLPVNGRNLAYLTKRGITKEATEYFHLRYCHDAFWDAGDYLIDFSKRVIIPVFDLDGNMVSFQGRDITGTAEKKYRFPNGFSSTGEHLYNGHNVVRASRACVGEGVFDVIATKIALDAEPELRDVVPVGTFGKHIAFGQISKFRQLMKRGLKQVTIMWDGEPQALIDAVNAGLELRKIGLAVRVAQLPLGKDPNEVSEGEIIRAFYTAINLTQQSAVSLLLRFQKLLVTANLQ
ncbi:hypothetical protein [Castellaniella sp.]|uniref:hypothetical protein n=1 Tax=Castellaniella sp. TaxID=1955812 RepID=UPI002AFF7410|nr:hypothetical protein [Castellaniella sp.]